jgi:hypothetical protein
VGFCTHETRRYPYPNPPKPIPVVAGMGFHGYGYGFLWETRGLPVPFPIAHYSHSTTLVSMLGTTSSHSWMPKGINSIHCSSKLSVFRSCNNIEHFRSYAPLYIHFLLLFDVFHVLCVWSCRFRMCRCICLIQSFVSRPWAVFLVDIFSIFEVV